MAVVTCHVHFHCAGSHEAGAACGASRVRHFSCKFRHKMALVRSPVQPSRHFGPVRSLSLWRSANFDIARATFSALWACQIALAVARCSLRWLAQPSRPFGPVGSLSLRRCAHFDGQGDLAQRSWQGGFLERSCPKILYREPESCYRDLVQRTWQDTSYGDLVQRHCIEICCRDLAQSCLT